MFTYNFKFELKSLVRSSWIQRLSVLLLALCLFAAFNGAQKVADRQVTVDKTKMESDSAFTVMLGVLDSVERGLKTDLSPWVNPQTPSVIGNRYPRLAVMESQPLALLATGQSDLFAHTVKPVLSGESTLLNFTELSSPVQLLFGSFDLNFVFVYLLPLIVIAFSYNLLSAEKEQGSLRLLMAQPVSLLTWLLQKAAIRFLIIATVATVSLWLGLVLNGVNFGANVGKIGQLTVLILTYTAFWFLVAALVNLAGKSSAQNAVTMLAIWVGLVLLVPSVVSQLANNLYPVPSRALLINQVRTANEEATRQADTILASYYRDHPELVPDSSKQEEYKFYKQYFASQELIQNKLKPMLRQYENRLAQQQAWVDGFRFASPAILLNDSFSDLAGTSTRHYQSYREQVIAFAARWRTYFKPIIFKSDVMSRNLIDGLPDFEYNATVVPLHSMNNLRSLLLYAALLVGLILTRFKNNALEKMVM
jgi:ABC-2 type transport system permease protein